MPVKEASVATAWIKTKRDGLSAVVGPFTLLVEPKGDGRWLWKVTLEGANGPAASGVASTLNGAKRTTEEFVKRSGRV
jgi:hypothetical protein